MSVYFLITVSSLKKPQHLVVAKGTAHYQELWEAAEKKWQPLVDFCPTETHPGGWHHYSFTFLTTALREGILSAAFCFLHLFFFNI